MTLDPAAPIATERLALVVVPLATLDAIAAAPGEEVAWPGVGWFDPHLTATLPARMRRDQLEADPGLAPWLVRAVVVPDATAPTGTTIVGHLGGHDRPDDQGTVEIGYTITPAWRRRGIATDAARAWFAWAHHLGARTAQLHIEAGNAASTRIAERLGLAPGEPVWDEDDGVWEVPWRSPLPLATPAAPPHDAPA